MMTRHIFLIGMPGCGKSSLGRRVAGNLRLPYRDTDAMVIQGAGCSTVTELFERYGEDAFRIAETNVLIQLTRDEPAIISTGGGMVMRETNRAIMRNHGLIVFIDRPLEQILSDIKLDRRPLLARKGLSGVEELYHQRIDTYRSVADFVLDNGNGYHAGMHAMERFLRNTFAGV